MVHHAVHPALKDQVPYAIVLVSITDAPGVLVAGNVIDSAPDAIRIGDAVRVVFAQVTDRSSGEVLRIPQWEVVQE